MMKVTWWGTFLGLLVLNLILVGPIWGKEFPQDEPQVITDHLRFLGELEAAGALRFFEVSEDILRLAQFERALLRFRFLKGQIQGKREYSTLVPMVDLRLQFLKRSMRLHDWQVAALPPMKAKRPKPKPPEVKPPPPPPPVAKPKNQDDFEDYTKESMISGSPTPKGKAAPPQATLPGTPPGTAPAIPQVTPPGKPPEVTGAPPKDKGTDKIYTDTDKVEEEKEKAKEGEEAKPPPPPPSFWQRLKTRIRGEKKAE